MEVQTSTSTAATLSSGFAVELSSAPPLTAINHINSQSSIRPAAAAAFFGDDNLSGHTGTRNHNHKSALPSHGSAPSNFTDNETRLNDAHHIVAAGRAKHDASADVIDRFFERHS